jgi:para-nitrobenzyl esterase
MSLRPLFAAALLFFAADGARAQNVATTDPAMAAQLALTALPAKAAARLDVSTPAFASGGDIPFENTRYRDNRFPGLVWTKGPPGTRSYAVIMQDPDSALTGAPILHWTLYDIPALVTRLEAGMTTPPLGAEAGPNFRGPAQGYAGPHTPAGPKHSYHVQVFALDIVIPADATLTYGGLTAAMSGHVLASGEVIGLGRRDPDAPPSPPRAPPPGAPHP